MSAFTFSPVRPNQQNNAADVNTPLTAAQSVVNGGLDSGNFSSGAGIPGTKLSASAAVAPTQLASNNLTVPRVLMRGMGTIPAATDYGYLYTEAGWATHNFPGMTTAGPPPRYWTYRTADHAVSGKTPVFRLRGVFINGTTATINYVRRLYLVNVVLSSGNYDTTSMTTLATTAGGTYAAGETEVNETTIAASSLTNNTSYAFRVFAFGVAPGGESLGFELSVYYT